VSEVLESNPHIKSFDLSFNEITDQDLQNIKLQETSLESLKLGNNNITDNGIINFLNENKFVRKLCLWSNDITSNGLRNLLKDYNIWKSLNVDANCQIEVNETQKEIRYLLLYNHILTKFEVKCTKEQKEVINSFTNANKNRHTFLFKIFEQYDLNINYLQTYAELENKKVIDKIVEDTFSESDESTSSDTADDTDSDLEENHNKKKRKYDSDSEENNRKKKTFKN
jgi:hypothetical protein